MHIWPDCYPCITKMFTKVARISLNDEQKIRSFADAIERKKPVSPQDFRITSPEIISRLWIIFSEMSGIDDPLKEVKKRQNDIALQLYPLVKESLLKDQDPLSSAVKFSITGNAIDIMTIAAEQPVEEIIKKLEGFMLDPASAEQLKERLRNAKRIVFLGDNCGEIVFDKILIETIRGYYGSDVVFIARTLPVLNDATLQDALYTGMDGATRTIENGIQQPLPGTIIGQLPQPLQELICESDLIISKGGGNYDTLSEEKGLDGRISFLLQAKCRPYATIFGAPLGSPVILNA